MDPPEPATTLRELLLRRDLALTRHRMAVCRRLGTDETELRALALLLHHGPMTASRLGALLGLSSGGVTHVVRRLALAGRLTRTPHPGDRRSRLLVLAPELEAALPGLLEPGAGALGPIAATDDVERFLTALAEATEAAADPPAAAPAPPRIVPSRWM